MSYLGTEPRFGTYPVQLITPNGTDTSFTLNESPTSEASIIVTIDGVKQQTDSYSVTGTTLAFGVGHPPAASTQIEVGYLGLASDGIPTVDQTLGTNALMRTNAQTINEDITIGATTNAVSGGPITIADGWTVTITAGGNWSVV